MNKVFTKKYYEEAVDAYNKYKPTSQADREQYENNKKEFLLVLENVVQGIKEINLVPTIYAEKPCEYQFRGCEVPVTGQVDLSDALKLIEIKTKYKTRKGLLKDGITRAFHKAKLEPSYGYFLQTNFYALATGLKPYLLMADSSQYKIYSIENCQEFEPEHQQKYYDDIRQTCIRRERLIQRHLGKNTWTHDVKLDTNNYYWKDEIDTAGDAKKIWNENLK